MQPDETVDIYYNLSSNGAKDERGPWNSDENFRYIADPMKEMKEGKEEDSSKTTVVSPKH